MKIVHICLGNFFIDNYSYQENLLPKFHKLDGYNVEVIASLATFDKNGNYSFLNNASEYINEYGIHVTRLNYKSPTLFYKKFKKYIGTLSALEEAKPDILFIHGCQFLDMKLVVKYLKIHSKVKVYVDNHADFSNSATNFFSKNILHKIVWKRMAQLIEPYTTKFYGVLPARVDFLQDVYGLPKEKCELLVMGADDEVVERSAKPEIREKIRKKYNIDKDDFLIITGGKIDPWKTQTLLLMEAVRNINNPQVKLIVFGSVTEDLKEKVNALCDGKLVQYIGWVQAEQSYDYFASSDLVVFPGRHSVFWEQVVAQGIPMLCKRWDGTTHVDIGGNVKFLEKDTTEEIQLEIERLINEPNVYEKMKNIAISERQNEFLYSGIAKKSLKD